MTRPTESTFIETREYRRFKEFCDTCRRYRYIGLCYGRPGVGKTLSARHFADWDRMESYRRYRAADGVKLHDVLSNNVVFYTARVSNTPGQIDREINVLREQVHSLRTEDLYRQQQALIYEVENAAIQASSPQERAAAVLHPSEKTTKSINDIRLKYVRKNALLPDSTQLIVIDEADRLTMKTLDQVRDIFDRSNIGVVLIGMPGLEKSLARYPQFYSRIGFVHEYLPLSQDDVRQLLEDRWRPEGIDLPHDGLADKEGIATIIRETQGNFRLLHRLLTQIGRVLEINRLDKVTREVVEAARESLVIGA